MTKPPQCECEADVCEAHVYEAHRESSLIGAPSPFVGFPKARCRFTPRSRSCAKYED